MGGAARSGRREQANPGDFCWRLRIGRERCGEQVEGEGEEKPNGGAHHGSLLGSSTCGGILCAMCQGRKPHFAN
jgi:hypothetical protein